MTDQKSPAPTRADETIDPLHLTLQQGLDRFATQYLPGRNLAARTRTEYLADLRQAHAYMKEELGVGHVTAVTRSHLERYLASLDQHGLKGSTRRRKATSLRVFFRFLHHEGYLAASPADELLPPAMEEHQPRFLTEAEYQRLLAAARHHPRDLAILELFLQTGIRRSELANVLVTDVELPAKFPRGERVIGVLHVRSGKGRKERTITLNDPACRALHAYLASRPDSDDPHLFLSKFRRGLGSWGIEDVVKKYLKIAGIANAAPHSLRHTFATQHVKRGTELPVVQAALGHENLATTSRYVGLVREQMDKRLQENAL
jgi:integrase/recombinase XerD